MVASFSDISGSEFYTGALVHGLIEDIYYTITDTSRNEDVLTDTSSNEYKYILNTLDTWSRFKEFIKKFNKETMVPIEPVYTGKMLYGFSQLLRSGVIPPGGEVFAIHTGGIHNKMSSSQRV